jgi:hypothetical protein
MRTYEPRPISPVEHPLEIKHIEDEIVVIGSGSVAFSMTIGAALETCRRLAEVLAAIDRPSYLEP